MLNLYLHSRKNITATVIITNKYKHFRSEKAISKEVTDLILHELLA